MTQTIGSNIVNIVGYMLEVDNNLYSLQYPYRSNKCHQKKYKYPLLNNNGKKIYSDLDKDKHPLS